MGPAGIIGVTQLLLRSKLDSEQQELAKLIQSSSDSLLNLINDILDLTRVEVSAPRQTHQHNHPNPTSPF
jgi:signal transduction histidine kinase